MSRLLLSVVLMSFAALAPIIGPAAARAQILNPGFESWSNGNPADWATSNAPPAIVNVTQSTDHHSGASSVQGAVVSVAGFPIPPAVVSGPAYNGFPINSRPGTLHGFYKFTSVSGDSLVVTVGFERLGLAIGGGQFKTSATTTQWQEFVANLIYQTGDIPDTVVIGVAIPTPAHIGSTFLLDDLSFGPAASVGGGGEEGPAAFRLQQNYPNPFNPATTIAYSLAQESHVTLRVYDLLGREVSTLVDGEGMPGSSTVRFDGGKLASGLYVYRLKAGDREQSRTMLLLK